MANTVLPKHRTLLDLYVSCSNVVKADVMSESDPFVRIFLKQSNWYFPNGMKISDFYQLSETQTQFDNPDPIFQNSTRISYHFSESQTLKFECWDYDSNGKHELIGVCQIEVGKLLHMPGSLCVMYLLDPKTGNKIMHKKRKMYQTLMARLDKVTDMDRDIILQFKPKNLCKIYNKYCNAYLKIRRRCDEMVRPNTNPPRKEEIEIFNPRNKGNNKTGVNANENPKWILKECNNNNNKNQNNQNNNNKENDFDDQMWPAIHIGFQNLCRCDRNKDNIIIEVWNANFDKQFDDLIGTCNYTYNELENGICKDLLYCTNNKKIVKRGEIEIIQCYMCPNIIDFLQAGTNISMMCAIDFNINNGDPRYKNSLHYCPQIMNVKTRNSMMNVSNYDKEETKTESASNNNNNNNKNRMKNDKNNNNNKNKNEEMKSSHYGLCLSAMSKMMSKYDSDKKIPSYGFGLSIQNAQSKINEQCFHLNKWIAIPSRNKIININNENNSENGNNNRNMDDSENGLFTKVEELEMLYYNTIQMLTKHPHFQMGKKTKLSDILSLAVNKARESHNDMIVFDDASQFNYHVLLILTNGNIDKSDEKLTKNLIADAANICYPLSIIIIGIGNGDFGFLKKLSDETKFKNSKGEKVERDIVQFVDFNKFVNLGSVGIENLTRDTTKEIPKQFLQYVLKHQSSMPKRTKAKTPNKIKGTNNSIFKQPFDLNFDEKAKRGIQSL